MSQKEKPQKIPKKTLIIGVIILISIIALTFRMLLHNIDYQETLNALSQVSLSVIPTTIFLMILYSFFEGLNMYRVFRLLNYETSVWSCLKYAMIGFFYSGITPSSSGGQPMQLYYMWQDGIRLSHGLCAVIMQIFGHIAANVILGITGYSLYHHILDPAVGNLKYLIILGIILNALYLIFLCVCLFSPKALNGIEMLLVWIFRKLDPAGTNKIFRKICDIFAEYKCVGVIIQEQRSIGIRTVLTSLVQLICTFSVSAVVYAGLGFHETPLIQVMFSQVISYISVGFIPIPGAAGISEAMSLLIYQTFYPDSILNSAVLLTRCLNSYFCIILYGISTLIFSKKLLTHRYLQKGELAK